MTAPALLLLLAAVSGPPFYVRPATEADDLKLLRAQVASSSPDERFWLERLRLYTDMGELRSIPTLVEELGAAFPGRPQFLEARMIFLSLDGKGEEAVALGERILREHPGYPSIRANLARVLLAAGRRAEGVNLMLAALESGPVRPEDWQLLLRGLGVGTEAPDALLARLRKKVADHPERLGLKYVLAIVATRLGRYEEARRVLLENPGLADHDDLRRFVSGARPPDVPLTPGREKSP